MKSGFYHAIGRVAYWFAILSALYSIFLLSWKIFGHSPQSDTLMSGFLVANIVATFGLYHYMGRFSGGLRYYTEHFNYRFNSLEKRFDSLLHEVKEVKNDVKTDLREFRGDLKEFKRDFSSLSMRKQHQ